MKVLRSGSRNTLRFWILFAFLVLWGTTILGTAEGAGRQSLTADGDGSPALRQAAEQRVSWRVQERLVNRNPPVEVKILAINDFHGQITSGKKVSGRPVGSAPVLASYFKAAMAGKEDQSFILHAGDHVGASPPQSALLQDEAEAINSHIPYLRLMGVRAVVALIHQGGTQTGYDGPTDTLKTGPAGAILDLVARLHDEVDVVISGHTHGFTNAIVKNNNGKEILLTQAWANGTAFADLNLEIDRCTKDVVAKSASVITTWADAGPGLTPDPDVAALVSEAEARVAPLVNQVIGTAAADLSRTQNEYKESALGNLIADAQRAAMGTDFTFMNPGGFPGNPGPVGGLVNRPRAMTGPPMGELRH
jgi:2',3'-cyclic-nucleotide 2'-phosphodiesterase (5'-nucleotidase family)